VAIPSNLLFLKRTLAPAGGFIPAHTFLANFSKYVFNSSWRLGLQQSFERGLCKDDRQNNLAFTNSGKTALFIVFRALSEKVDSRIIAVSAFTCPDVAAAAARAGFKIFPIEQQKDSFDLDFMSLENFSKNSDIACVVLSNLYGLADNFSEVRKVVSEKTLIIDDGCQSLIELEPRLSNRGPSIAVFSAGRGKALCGVGGGVVFCNAASESKNDLSKEVFLRSREIISESSEQSVLQNFKSFLKCVLFPVLEHPRFFWMPMSLPFLKLGQVVCEYEFKSQQIGFVEKCVLLFQWNNISVRKKVLFENTKKWQEALRQAGLEKFNEKRLSEANLAVTRYPILCENSQQRDAILSRLKDQGLGSTASYAKTIDTFGELSEHCLESGRENSNSLANRVITLPVHKFLTDYDINNTLAILAEETIRK